MHYCYFAMCTHIVYKIQWIYIRVLYSVPTLRMLTFWRFPDENSTGFIDRLRRVHLVSIVHWILKNLLVMVRLFVLPRYLICFGDKAKSRTITSKWIQNWRKNLQFLQCTSQQKPAKIGRMYSCWCENFKKKITKKEIIVLRAYILVQIIANRTARR